MPTSASPRAAHPDDRLPLAAGVLLAVGAFAAVTSEALPAGLLPQLSAGLRTTEAEAGLLVGVFALTVALTSAPLTILLRRVERRRLIQLSLVVVAVAAVATAVSSTFPAAMAARVVGGLGHGLFWAILNAYLARIASARHLPTLLALTQTGGSLAFVLGVPVGAFVGQGLGWPVPFVAIAVLAGVLAVLVLRMPRVPGSVAAPRREQGAAGDPSVPAVATVCAAVAVVMIGAFTLSTFAVPWLETRAGVPTASVPLVLLAGGGASVAAQLTIAIRLGRAPARGVVVAGSALLGIGALLAILPAGAPAVVGWVAMTASFGLLPPLLIASLMRTATERVRDVASAAYTTAFNIGIGGGAAFGGVVLARAGVEAVPLAQTGAVALGLAVFTGGLLLVRTRGRGAAQRDGAALDERRHGTDGGTLGDERPA